MLDQNSRDVTTGITSKSMRSCHAVIQGSQRFLVRRFHYLKTAGVLRIDPTGVVADALWQHPTAISEPLADWLGITVFEKFNNHKKHGVPTPVRISASVQIP